MDERLLEERVAEIQAMKRFGEGVGLNFGEEMFSEVQRGEQPSFYWLYASHKDRIESALFWTRSALPYAICAFLARYPLVRHIPRLFLQRVSMEYEMFDSQKLDAEARARELEDKGLDVLLFEAEAYGGPECPLTLSVLEAEPARRAYVVFHEGLHVHIRKHWDKGGANIPPELEEPLADYFGTTLASRYFEEHAPESIGAARLQSQDVATFFDFVVAYHDRLSECYARGGKAREAILAEAREEALRLRGGCETAWVKDRFSSPINNAFFLRYITYSKHRPLVGTALESVSISDYLKDPDTVNTILLERIGERHG